MRGTPLLIALIIIASVGITPGTAVAQDDDWPDGCSGSPVIEGGTVSGKLSAPDDVDVFRIRLQRGQNIKITTDFPVDKAQSPLIDVGGGYVDYPDMTGEDAEIRGVTDAGVNDAYDIRLGKNSRTHSFEIWGITDWWSENPLCVVVEDMGWETLYEWELNIERSNPDVTLFEVRELEDRIVELQNQLDEAEGDSERVSELESQLEEKNQTISELESRVEELESQSSDGSGDGDVTIDVTVNPGDGQENFVEGGQAVVQAESESADVSNMRVEYGAGTYELDSSGEVAIPLAQTGTQEMTLVYGDTTEQVSIDVQAQADSQQDDSGASSDGQQDVAGEDGSGDEGVSSGGPGFGIAAAVIALLGTAFILRRLR